MGSKSIFKSSTFWMNLLSIPVTYLLEHQGLLPKDPTVTLVILAVLNILKRLTTQTAVHIA